jgi:hypothetical protein
MTMVMVFIQSQTMESSMRIIDAIGCFYLCDLRMYLRTDKYVKQNQSTSNRVEVKRVLQEKANSM